MSIEGVDYSTDRPTVTGLVAAGKRFACRYGGPGTSPKHLTVTEANALRAAGISIVANAEGAEDGLLGGFAVGADWARRADAHFRACGMPPDRPIYLSVDFDVRSDVWFKVANALRGAASVIGPERVGVYGGLRAVQWARRDRVARWFWQTYAWSGGTWAAGNHIEQYDNHVPLAGGTVDLDRALPADYGQWGVDDMALTEADAKLILDYDYIPSGDSANPTYATRTVLAILLARTAALQKDVDELQARPAVVAGPVDVEAIATAVADVLAARLVQ